MTIGAQTAESAQIGRRELADKAVRAPIAPECRLTES
jgi:hypothetical protein